jgi:hypothetical protein
LYSKPPPFCLFCFTCIGVMWNGFVIGSMTWARQLAMTSLMDSGFAPG